MTKNNFTTEGTETAFVIPRSEATRNPYSRRAVSGGACPGNRDASLRSA